MIQFGKDICSSLEQATSREWLETNGIGGYASSTVAGLNTRRYHGLLIAATEPPVGRSLLLAKLEESLLIDSDRYELSANQYPGTVHPKGYELMCQFELNPFPVFVFRVGGCEIRKTIFMVHGENTTVVDYSITLPYSDKTPLEARPGHFAQLDIRPLVAFRDHHELARQNLKFNTLIRAGPEIAWIQPYEHLPALNFVQNADALDPTGYWYFNMQYDRERERGLDFEEDLYSPFALRFLLAKRRSFSIIISTERRNVLQAAALKYAEKRRRAALLSAAPSQDELTRTLVASADHYVVSRGDHKTIVAGYHWFADWGRDTMIALPGLTLATGRYDEARSILLAFVRNLEQGLIPNRIPESRLAPEYNTADATLWLFEAVRAFLEYTGNYPFVENQLYSQMSGVIDWHIHGTLYGIHLDEDGMLAAGEANTQLTWMDAAVDGHPVTPRNGKPVELQALWYNALRIIEELAREFGDIESAERYASAAEETKTTFNRLFWNEEEGCLFDLVDGEFKDPSIRPNEILAASLRHTMLEPDRARKVVAVVERQLLTPRGLRSLSAEDSRYCPHYIGGWEKRDGAYHQGTVWAWLMGPFLSAFMRFYPEEARQGRKVRQWIAGFRDHLTEAGLGHISEIFDGDPPHTPRGCIAQAWSVGEILRALCEDVHGFGPSRHRPFPLEEP